MILLKNLGPIGLILKCLDGQGEWMVMSILKIFQADISVAKPSGSGFIHCLLTGSLIYFNFKKPTATNLTIQRKSDAEIQRRLVGGTSGAGLFSW